MSYRSKAAVPVLACLVIAAAAAVGGQSARAQSLGVNLVTNGNAEAGPGSATGDVVAVPGWATTGAFTVVPYDAAGGFPSFVGPGPADRGVNFFAGGPNSAVSAATQTISITTLTTSVNAGQVGYSLSAFLGGFENQDDAATLTVTFLGASDVSLGSAAVGPVTGADRSGVIGLLLRSVTGLVPVGTQSIGVRLSMTRADGAYNDGYADNVSLVLNDTASAPEPGTALLVSSAVPLWAATWGAYRRRRRRAATAV